MRQDQKRLRECYRMLLAKNKDFKMRAISEKAMRSLIEYLEAHDEDIANEENDFGDLKEVYQELCERNKEPGWIQEGIKTFCKDTHMSGY